MNELRGYKQLMEEIKNNIKEYEENTKHNEVYEPNESAIENIKKEINSLESIIMKKVEIDEFFQRCNENMRMKKEKMNEVINKILKKKKQEGNREDYLNYRRELGKYRSENEQERNHRECEEMLDDIRYEKEMMMRTIEKERMMMKELMNELRKHTKEAHEERKGLIGQRLEILKQRIDNKDK